MRLFTVAAGKPTDVDPGGRPTICPEVGGQRQRVFTVSSGKYFLGFTLLKAGDWAVLAPKVTDRPDFS